MDTFAAYARAEAARAANQPCKFFDWDKAAEIIKATNGTNAAAGLIEDWEWTGGDILRDGKPVPEEDTYVYLSSIWATPALIVDDVECECWTYDSKYDGQYWPESAMEILNEH